ncbi:hypothetical protein LTR85_000703 [Meristemomyces frigidus]|nr:hypothetical protein LTR85_000703 [Meristemomyces frigidus]
MTPNVDDFEYRPLFADRQEEPTLDLKREEIRLVEILPGTGRIHCVIRHVRLADDQQYTTLSYACGSPEKDRKIILKYADSHLRKAEPIAPNLSVTSNLFEALEHLREGYATAAQSKVLFWIDGLSINQAAAADTNEKPRQVRLMRYVYSKAHQTIIWLGPEKPESSLDVEFLTKLLQVRREQRGREPPDTRTIFQFPIRLKGMEVWTKEYDLPLPPDKQYKQLYTFLDRGWFARTWIVQEAALSTDAVIHSGTKVIPLVDFLEAVMYCTHALGVGAVYKGANVLEVTKLYNAWFSRQNRSQDGRVNQGLLEVLQQHRDSSALDPRDKVFALLGLAADLQGLNLVVGYTPRFEPTQGRTGQQRRENLEGVYRDTGERYTALAGELIRSSGSLDLLSYVRSSGDTVDTATNNNWSTVLRYLRPSNRQRQDTPSVVSPSWVPDWTYQDSFTTFCTRDEHGKYSYPFAAAASAEVDDIKFDGEVLKGGCVLKGGNVLNVKAFEWDTIGDIRQQWGVSGGKSTFGFIREYRQALSKQRIIHHWARLCDVRRLNLTYDNNDTGDPESMLSAYWHTLVAGGTLDGVPITEEEFNGYYSNTRPFDWIFDYHIYSIPLLCHVACVAVLAYIALRNLTGEGDVGLKFQTRMGLTTPNRRMFRSATHHSMGLAPANAKVGDSVILCKGAMVPLVVRRQDGQWRLIGDAYVHGIMMGGVSKHLGAGALMDII